MLKDEKRQKIEDLNRRREENKKRREENERKSEVVQVVSGIIRSYCNMCFCTFILSDQEPGQDKTHEEETVEKIGQKRHSQFGAKRIMMAVKCLLLLCHIFLKI